MRHVTPVYVVELRRGVDADAGSNANSVPGRTSMLPIGAAAMMLENTTCSGYPELEGVNVCSVSSASESKGCVVKYCSLSLSHKHLSSPAWPMSSGSLTVTGSASLTSTATAFGSLFAIGFLSATASAFGSLSGSPTASETVSEIGSENGCSAAFDWDSASN